MATRRDYDRDPDRFRLASELTATYLRSGISLYEKIAELLTELDATAIPFQDNTFDVEDAPDIVASVFGDVCVDR